MNSKTHLSFSGWIFASLFCALTTFAREGAPPLSRLGLARPLPTVRQLVVPPVDQAAELAADERSGRTAPVRFAVGNEVAITPSTHGTWEEVPGGRLWRLRVVSAGATDLNFGFTTYWMPKGATLHISSEDEDYAQGPYSAIDNKEHAQLWTPVIPGSRGVIEVFVPDNVEQPQLVLSQVSSGYRDMFGRRKNGDGPKSHGPCNIDAICPIGIPWRTEIRSVGVYARNGVLLCSGTLVNTTRTPNTNQYFLTANHCGITSGNAATVVVYWNYQAPVCGQQGGGSLAQNQSGSFFRAARADVDMALIELDEVPSPTFQVTYAGWDRSGTVPSGVIGIHHPQVDVKSISFSSNALTTVNNCIGGGGINSHWRVVWTHGTTEQGSSGSGIWDLNTRRLVGFLSGGTASCDDPTFPDCYGKFSVAWDGPSTATRLKEWLDPQGTGATSVNGFDPFSLPNVQPILAELVSESCTPTNRAIDPGETVTVSLSLRNLGGAHTPPVVATLLVTNGVTAPSVPRNYGVLEANGIIMTRDFTFTATGNCGGLVIATLQLQAGATNLGNVTFSLRLGVPNGLVQNFDGVTAPALPTGWSNSAAGSTGWRTDITDSHTAPNSALALDVAVISDSSLYSPILNITSSNATMTFAHRYQLEPTYDGGVLEISLNGGAYTDLLAAGGSFASGGYSGTIDNRFGNPLGGRGGWTGNSAAFITTTVNFPATAAGKTVRLRWRLGTDSSNEVAPFYGWNVDTVSIADSYVCCRNLITPQIIETRRTNNSIVFSFNTVAGQTYVTEYKNVLGSNVVWTPLQTNTGDGSKKSVTNSTTASTNRFFRVRGQ